MLKTKVKINQVNNLTDARYFAAMGADYLGFCCNLGTEKYCSPNKIKEITDWVAGPQFVLEFDGWQSKDDIQSILNDNNGQAIHIGPFASYENNFSVPVFKDVLLESLEESINTGIDFPVIRSEKPFSQLTNIELQSINQLLLIKPCFLDLNFKPEEIFYIIEHLPCYGIILRGGEEEKIGMKSFEELDHIFSLLEV
ncbi:MAG: hypothetical protein IPO92_20960 [Saprospiraceae bacterium]|nr:hypothetical protein [Saprospiraceae bacterium]